MDIEQQAECKAAFEEYLKKHAISNEKTVDTWGKEIYAHTHVQSAFYSFWEAYDELCGVAANVANGVERIPCLMVDYEYDYNSGSGHQTGRNRVFLKNVSAPSTEQDIDNIAELLKKKHPNSYRMFVDKWVQLVS